MSLTHWQAPKGTVRKMNLSAGRRLRPRGTPPLMIKQNATECVQPVLHYYPACALNVSRRRRDDSIDLMKVLFIFSQILSPVITKALHYCGQLVLNLLSVEGDSLFASYACSVILACSFRSISYQTQSNGVKTCSHHISAVKLTSLSELIKT